MLGQKPIVPRTPVLSRRSLFGGAHGVKKPAQAPVGVTEEEIAAKQAQLDASAKEGLVPAGSTVDVVAGLGKNRSIHFGKSPFVPDPILGGGYLTTPTSAENRKRAMAEERLRFLREQTRQGRLSSILTGGTRQASASGGFQLGRKTVLGA